MVLLGLVFGVSCVYLGYCSFALSLPQLSDWLEITVSRMTCCVEWDVKMYVTHSFTVCNCLHNVAVLKEPGLLPARKKREYKKRKHKQATTIVQPTATTIPPVRLQSYIDVGTLLHCGRQPSSDEELSVSLMLMSRFGVCCCHCH